MQKDEAWVRPQLDRAAQQVRKQVREVSIPSEAGLIPALEASLQQRWGDLNLNEDQELALAQKAVKKAERGSGRIRVLNYTKEIVFTTLGIVLAVGLFFTFNRLVPDPQEASFRLTQTAEARPPQSQSQFRLDPQRTPGTRRGFRNRLTPHPTATPTPYPKDFFYTVQPGDTLWSIAQKLGTTVDELTALNRLADPNLIREGMQLLIPGRVEVNSAPEQAQNSPVEADPLATIPQTTDQLLALIERSRIENSQPFWVDATLVTYGPAGYIGPPQVERLQIWNSQQEILAVLGSLPTAPDEALPAQGVVEDVFLYLQDNGSYRAKPGSGQPWYINLQPSQIEQSPAYLDLTCMFQVRRQCGGTLYNFELGVVGEDITAGRDTLIVEQSSRIDAGKVRLWVDRQNGLILRRQVFADPAEQTLVEEFKINQIDFEPNFPPDLFDPQLPWRGGFAKDSSGEPDSGIFTRVDWDAAPGHTPLQFQEPPSGFDPSQQPAHVPVTAYL